MIIKRLSASFGRLSGDTLDLKDGLNIIEAPNECGKSTWCAFIRTMLYGLKTSDRDKQGYLSDKTRYRPWNGSAMAGSMDIETGGRRLTLERLTQGKLPMKEFRAVYSGTGTLCEDLYPDTAGETLLGVSEEVFERSAFISQAGIKVGQTPELEKRISSLVSTGDETSSYTEADERLRLWLRRRRFNKSGTIPVLEEKLTGVARKLAAIEAAQDQTADMRLEAERLKKRQNELSAELKAYDEYEARQSGRRAAEKLEAAKAGYDNLSRELAKNGPAPSESDISAIRGELKALETLRAMTAAEQKHLRETLENNTRLLEDRAATPFADSNADEAVKEAEALKGRLKNLSFGSPLTILAVVLFVLAAVLAVVMPAFRLYAAAAAILFVIVVIVRAILLGGARLKLVRYLSGFGVDSIEALKNLRDEDGVLSAELAASEGEVRAAEKSAANSEASYDALLQTLNTRLRAFSLPTDLAALAGALDRIAALHGKLAAAKSELMAAESFLKSVEEASPTGTADGDGKPFDSVPARTRQEIAADLATLTARREDLAGRYNMALGEIRALGDPVLLGSEKQLTEAELTAQKLQFDALTLAVDALKDASTELQTRFSPLLSDTAGQIIGRLTGGRYDKLAFDKTFDALAKTADETVSRSILALSAGTADQIYLALRLAVVELILPDADPCPLILDDALSNFDDKRMGLALDCLRELAGRRQVLLFTCQGREAAYFAKYNSVNILKLM